MEKACLCGKTRTNEALARFCRHCFTYTLGVYGLRRVFARSWRDNHMGAVEAGG